MKKTQSFFPTAATAGKKQYETSSRNDAVLLHSKPKIHSILISLTKKSFSSPITPCFLGYSNQGAEARNSRKVKKKVSRTA
jgi:hypothetical protein